MDRVIGKGEDLKIVGVVKPKKDVDFTVLNGDIYYPASLTDHMIQKAADSKVVRPRRRAGTSTSSREKNSARRATDRTSNPCFPLTKTPLPKPSNSIRPRSARP